MTARSHLHIARVTLQCETALSIASGSTDGAFDVDLVRDANGLPSIPGTALAGVLRHLYSGTFGPEATEALFGFQKKDEGQISSVEVSWGCMQDSAGRAVEGLLLGDAAKRLEADPLLRFARELAAVPVTRERVRIGHRGAAADRGKFDRAVLPAGYRFSAEVVLWSGGDETASRNWQNLLSLLVHPEMRLGGGTRAGLGAMSIAEVYARTFDLRRERQAFAAISRSVGDTSGLKKVDVARGGKLPKVYSIRLEPRSFWRIGRGDVSLRKTNDKEPDARPRVERRVVWTNGTGRLSEAGEWLVIPWSAIKGALAHRVAFHANRLSGIFADTLGAEGLASYDKAESEPVRDLFGFARNDRGSEEGAAGRLAANDVYVRVDPKHVAHLSHNAIDRFTGGVRQHVLFNEEVLWKHDFTLQLMLFPPRRGADANVAAVAEKALDHALRDLTSGCLPIGAGAADGHGFFAGTVREEVARER